MVLLYKFIEFILIHDYIFEIVTILFYLYRIFFKHDFHPHIPIYFWLSTTCLRVAIEIWLGKLWKSTDYFLPFFFFADSFGFIIVLSSAYLSTFLELVI